MKPSIPNTTADQGSAEVQALIDRFARARWIDGLNIAHPGFFSLQLTELGKDRMSHLGELVRPLAAYAVDRARRPGLLGWLRLLFRIRRIAGCLQPPALSRSEIDTLIRMAALYDRERHTN